MIQLCIAKNTATLLRPSKCEGPCIRPLTITPWRPCRSVRLRPQPTRRTRWKLVGNQGCQHGLATSFQLVRLVGCGLYDWRLRMNQFADTEFRRRIIDTCCVFTDVSDMRLANRVSHRQRPHGPTDRRSSVCVFSCWIITSTF